MFSAISAFDSTHVAMARDTLIHILPRASINQDLAEMLSRRALEFTENDLFMDSGDPKQSRMRLCKFAEGALQYVEVSTTCKVHGLLALELLA